MANRPKPEFDNEQIKKGMALAIERCDASIKWYDTHQRTQRQRMATTRLTAIFVSGLVPVLVIVQMSLKPATVWWVVLSVLIALFPAVATILSAMNQTFQYKENFIRFTEAAEELKSEKIKFLTRTTKQYDLSLDEYQTLGNFVSRIEAITINETKKWRIQVEQGKELDELLKTVIQ